MGLAYSSSGRAIPLYEALSGLSDIEPDQVFLFRASDLIDNGHYKSAAHGVSISPDGGLAIRCENGICYQSRLNLRAPPGEDTAVALRVRPQDWYGPELAKVVLFATDPRREQPAALNGSGFIRLAHGGEDRFREAEQLAAWLQRAIGTGALRPWSLFESDALHAGALAEALAWEADEGDSGWATGQQQQQQCGPPGIALKLRNGDLVEVIPELIERCLRLRIAARRARGQTCGQDRRGQSRTFKVLDASALAGLPDSEQINAAEVSEAFDILLGVSEPAAAQAGANATYEEVARTQRIQRLWRYFSCSNDSQPMTDRNWIPINVLKCVGCQQVYRGFSSEKVRDVWTNCAPGCPAKLALCRACALAALGSSTNADAQPAACPICKKQLPRNSIRELTGPDLVVRFNQPSGGPEEVVVSAGAIQNCALLLSFASRGTAVNSEDLLPPRIGPETFRQAMDMLPGTPVEDESPYEGIEDQATAEAVYDIHTYLGCSPWEGSSPMRDWAIPNPQPCNLCREAFAGRSTGPFWACSVRNCASMTAICRVCTWNLISKGDPCPYCRARPL